MGSRLVDMELDEISLVKKGANQFSTVAIAKSLQGEEEEMEEDLFDENGDPIDPGELDLGDVVYDDDGNAFEVVDDEEEDAEEEVGKALNFRRLANTAFYGAQDVAGKGKKAFRGAKRGLNRAQMGYGQGRTDAVLRRSTGGQTRAITGSGDIPGTRERRNIGATGSAGYFVGRNRNAVAAGTGGVALGGGTAYGVNEHNKKKRVSKSFDLREEFSKALTDDDRDQVISKAFEQIERLSEENQLALEIAKSEQQARIFNEYVSIAKTYTLPFEDEKVAQVMMEAEQKLSPEACDIIAKSFEMASDLIGSEIGVEGIGSDTMQGIENTLEEIGKSADPTTITELLEQHPELYDQYLADR